jgi:hypothetical protein
MTFESPRIADGVPARLITCVVPRQGRAEYRDLLESLGIGEFTLQAARRTLLRERRRPRGATPLMDELVDVLRFRVPDRSEASIIPALVDAFGFGEPGRGNLVVRPVSIAGIEPGSPPAGPAESPKDRASGGARLIGDLAGLCCIVPRGEGTAIARIALEAGLCAPVVTYGRGVGSRGRLGLIRITIPAEKEIVTMLISRHDLDEALRLVTEVMKLGRPGAGFCYWFPLSGGILDTRIWVGRQPYVASMEQVIAALDVMSGGTEWRRKAERVQSAAGRPAALADYSICGNEGETESIVSSALEAGAGGATRSWMRRERLGGAETRPSAREENVLIVAESALPAIHAAVEKAGLAGQDCCVEVSRVGAASGYHAPVEGA